MTITLLDGNKEYAEVARREYGKSKTVWCQTGLGNLKGCCLSRYLICKDGRVYGRIATEMVQAGVYNGLEYTVKDDSQLGKMLQYHIKEMLNKEVK